MWYHDVILLFGCALNPNLLFKKDDGEIVRTGSFKANLEPSWWYILPFFLKLTCFKSLPQEAAKEAAKAEKADKSRASVQLSIVLLQLGLALLGSVGLSPHASHEKQISVNKAI